MHKMELGEQIIILLASILCVLLLPIIAIIVNHEIQKYRNKKEKKHNEKQRDS